MRCRRGGGRRRGGDRSVRFNLRRLVRRSCFNRDNEAYDCQEAKGETNQAFSERNLPFKCCPTD